jgi:hypothetical protein
MIQDSHVRQHFCKIYVTKDAVTLRGQDSGQGKSAAHDTICQPCAKNLDVPAQCAKIIGACATRCTSAHGCQRAPIHTFSDHNRNFIPVCCCCGIRHGIRHQTRIFGMVEVVKHVQFTNIVSCADVMCNTFASPLSGLLTSPFIAALPRTLMALNIMTITGCDWLERTDWQTVRRTASNFSDEEVSRRWVVLKTPCRPAESSEAKDSHEDTQKYKNRGCIHQRA